MFKIITIFILIIFNSNTYAEINLHSVDLHKINVPIKKTKFKKDIDITFNIEKKTEIFLCFSFGKQNKRRFHEETTYLFEKEKNTQETKNIKQERIAFLENTNKQLHYQLYKSKDSIFILKNKLLSNNNNDVLAATIYPNSENPFVLSYFIEVSDDFFTAIPGIYYDVFSVDLYKGVIEDQQTATLLESKDIKIQFEVPYVSLIKEEAKLNDGSRCFYVNSNSRHQVSVSQVNEDKPKALEFVKMGPLITFTPDPNEKGYIVIEIQDLE